MDFEVVGQHETEEGKELYDVRIGEETFNAIKPIVKSDNQMCRKCKYYDWDNNCCSEGPVLRKFDCKRNVDKLHNGFNTVTALMAVAMFGFIFYVLQFAFFTKVGALIFGVVALDVASTFIEKRVPKIYNRFSYRMWKKEKVKTERLEEATRKEEEALKKKQEAERMLNEQYYENVQRARAIVKTLREVSDQHHFGPNEEKINSCVEICETMLQKLEEDTSSYSEVRSLFEVYIPAFLATLEQYVVLANDNAEMEEHEKALTECVDIILQYVEQKSKGDQHTARIMFRASTNALKNQVRKELDK